MQSPPVLSDEVFRLEALRSLCILDTPDEERFDRITRSIAHLFKVPIALVSLVDSTRQWFKSRVGLDATETSREVSFCAHAIAGNTVFVVEDAASDPRFSDNPLVTGPPYIRFYAGVPLRGPGGAKIGSLCLIDREPRLFPPGDRDSLIELGAWAEREILHTTLQKALGATSESEAFFLLNPELACVAGLDGILRKVNPSFSRMLGYTAEELMKIPFMDFVYSEDRSLARDAMANLATGEVVQGLENRLVAKDGSLRWTNWTSRAIDGLIYASGRDTTELKATQELLSESESRYKGLTDLSPDIVARHDLEGRFTFVSPALTRLLGLSLEQVLGHSPAEFVVPDDQENLKRFFRDLLAGLAPEPAQFRTIAADGTHVWLEARGALVLDMEGRSKEAVICSRDITDIKALEVRLIETSIRDGLTGLYNRRFFMERLDAFIVSARRHGHPMSLCLCDLDRFKAINDTYGHNAGDEVLRGFSRLIQEEVRSEDLVARLGGDEFCFLFPFTPAVEAKDCLERILIKTRTLRFSGPDRIPFTISATFGLADWVQEQTTIEHLLEAADRSLYRAKAKGRDCIHLG